MGVKQFYIVDGSATLLLLAASFRVKFPALLGLCEVVHKCPDKIRGLTMMHRNLNITRNPRKRRGFAGGYPSLAGIASTHSCNNEQDKVVSQGAPGSFTTHTTVLEQPKLRIHHPDTVIDRPQA